VRWTKRHLEVRILSPQAASAQIMRCGLTLHLGRTRLADVGSNDSEILSRIRSLAGYIIVTRESDFSDMPPSHGTPTADFWRLRPAPNWTQAGDKDAAN
jgi:predicted nuclease of predicted toxin-antitoxin system